MNIRRVVNIRRVLLISAPVLVAAVVLFFYLTGERFVDTDNAYVKADKVTIAPEVSAAVDAVLVKENEQCHPGSTPVQVGCFAVCCCGGSRPCAAGKGTN
jgi:membrane fusion protein (multidrug efflux system)